mmetsp:Transcript_22112/g.59663  ORF Transcript_22112/g.59663 Transcript_22112/m.59663 type:complete len:98 (-) Transcript_22112:224-517(-)
MASSSMADGSSDSELRRGPVALAPRRRLVDVDWALCVSAGTSEVDVSGCTLVRVALTHASEDGDAHSITTHAELSLSHFFALLHALERTRGVLKAGV